MRQSAFLPLLAFVSVISGLFAPGAFAWGEYGHEQVNDAAINLLGPKHPLGQCLHLSRYWVKRLAITPDADWKADSQEPGLPPADAEKRFDNDRYERSLHYFQVDGFLRSPRPEDILRLPVGEYREVFPAYRELLARNLPFLLRLAPWTIFANPPFPSVNEVVAQGTAPWRAVQLFRLAVRSLAAGNTKLALVALGTLGHYVGDLSQPFHTTANFDGATWPTPAAGIHSEIDTSLLPTTGKDPNDVYPNFKRTEGPVLAAGRRALKILGTQPVPDSRVVPELLGLIAEGYPFVNRLLGAYATQCAIANSRTIGKPYCKNIDGIPQQASVNRLPAIYRRAFAATDLGQGTVSQYILHRLGYSAGLTAHLWNSVYAAAGSPELRDCVSPPGFDRSLAIQAYPQPNSPSAAGYLPDGYVPRPPRIPRPVPVPARTRVR